MQLLMATVGEDFSSYEKRLSKLDSVQDYVKEVPESLDSAGLHHYRFR